jgi:predicted permease
MRSLGYVRSLAAKFFHPAEVAGDMEEELRSHVQHRADDLQRSGLERTEAERRARIEFGGHTRFREECHEALGGNFIETVVQDVRFSLRVLRKSPGFTIAAVLTLALGIGANAVVFGVLNALILRPLNVPQAESLWGTAYGNGADTGFQSYPNYVDLRDRNRSFDPKFGGLAAWNFASVALDSGNDPSLVWGFAASGNYFDVLRIQPYLGRFFHSSDEHGPASAPYVVLSFAYWHSHFADDRGVVGRTVLLNKHPFTIIGVAPPEFHGTLLFVSPEFFIPIVNQDQVNGQSILNQRGNTHAIFETVGHLRPGVTPAQAVDDLKTVGAYLAKNYPKEFGQKDFSLTRAGLTSFGGAVKAFMTGLMLLAGLILLAACANLGSLFAAHAADRSREVALRLALGSSRARILRQLLSEAILISLVGGALGLWGSVTLLSSLSTWQPFPGTPVLVPVSPDARLYLVALALALISGLLFGMVPVRRVLRTDPYQIVKAGSTQTVGRRITVRDVLLGVQIAICAVLVTSSMVAVRGLVRSLRSNFGFEPRNTMLVSADLATAGYSGEAVAAMQKHMIDAVKSIPGVQQVGLVNNYPPLVNAAGNRASVFKDQTADLTPSNAAGMPYRYEISPNYFQAASTTLLVGRDFTWHDDKNAPAVTVINREFAMKMFGAVTKAVGQYYKLQDGTRVQVVGVVEDGKYLSLTEDQKEAMFLPFLQSAASPLCLVVRSTGDSQQLAAAIRSKLRELDAGLAVDAQTWNSMLQIVLFPSQVATVALGVLGLMGAMLSITGIFGMAAYSVSKRLKELGIRMALGAQHQEVLRAALGRAFKLLAFGSTAGLVLGILASRVLASIVYQATPRDPLVLAGVVLIMALLGLLATWIPAHRALALDPLTLLRED